MTFDAFRQHLGSVHRSAVTGRPLGRDAAGDYPSRIRRLQALLKIPLENAPPIVLRSLAGSLRQDGRVVSSVPSRVIGDIVVALRAYATFLEGHVVTGIGSLLDPQVVHEALIALNFRSVPTSDKNIVQLMRGAIILYVRLDSRESIIIHPEFEVYYSMLASALGSNYPVRVKFYHNSYMTSFPQRDNGHGKMHYGIQLAVANRSVIKELIARLDDALTFASPFEPHKTLKEETLEPDTEKVALHRARIGQGRFRADLLDLWQGHCALTEVNIPELLRASHIKPWRTSNNSERLNAFNGLLLAVHLDALFDRLLITFQDTGEMVVSKKLSLQEQEVFGIASAPRRLLLSVTHLQFMRDHQNRFAVNERKHT